MGWACPLKIEEPDTEGVQIRPDDDLEDEPSARSVRVGGRRDSPRPVPGLQIFVLPTGFA
jgi:hypothetical protein